MAIAEEPRRVRDSVSEDTLNALRFFTGESATKIRNVTLNVMLDGHQYEVHFGPDGKVEVLGKTTVQGDDER